VKTVALYNFGCKVNQYDGHKILDMLKENGFVQVDHRNKADCFVVNGCTVTNVADSKCRKTVRRLQREYPGGKIAVTGCYATRTNHGNMFSSENVKLFPFGYEQNIPGFFGIDGSKPEVSRSISSPRAYLKVQDGCKAMCSFCIVPHVRSILTFKQIEDAVVEAGCLVKKGVKEIIVCGINLTYYKPGIINLLRELLQIEGLVRIRMSSLSPLNVTPGLVELVAREPRLCKHFHIPLQSGSDRILQAMHRNYTSSNFKEKVTLIRKNVQDVGITTDVMVGFPGETESDFERTLNMVQEVRFSRLHVFRFSPREGTLAETLPGRVTERIVKERSEQLSSLDRNLRQDFAGSFVGKTLDFLPEEKVGRKASGYSSNYIPVVASTAGSGTLKGNGVLSVPISRAVSGVCYTT
jgi:threonylcarbamoyladenosine tRNA methylthiotransferase MtaB